jgi:hypothetical protein
MSGPIGIKPGDAVLLVERRREQQIVYNALVVGISMNETLAGTHGEPSIEVAFFAGMRALSDPVLRLPEVVHISHKDWMEGRREMGYEELPSPPSGVCRFCGCTERRPCDGGCAWADPDDTICSSMACLAKYDAWAQAQRTEFLKP